MSISSDKLMNCSNAKKLHFFNLNGDDDCVVHNFVCVNASWENSRHENHFLDERVTLWAENNFLNNEEDILVTQLCFYVLYNERDIMRFFLKIKHVKWIPQVLMCYLRPHTIWPSFYELCQLLLIRIDSKDKQFFKAH